MLTLAQQVAMNHFPGGPALDVWLFERPIPTMVVIVALGFIGSYVLRQRGSERWWLAPVLGSVILAAGTFSLANAVETDREAIERGTRDWVDAMATGQRLDARALLNAEVVLAAAGTEWPIDVDAFAGISEGAAARIDSYNLRRVSTTMDGENVGRTRFEITVGADGTPFPMGWELGWWRSGGTWSIVRAECLHVWNTPPQNNFRRWVPELRR